MTRSPTDKAGDVGAEFRDLAGGFVAEHRGEGHGERAFDRFQIGVAQAGGADAHQHVAGGERADVQCFDGHGRAGLAQHGGAGAWHVFPPSARA